MLGTNKVKGSTIIIKLKGILFSRQQSIAKCEYYFPDMREIQSHKSSSSPIDPVSIYQAIGASFLSPLHSIAGNGWNVSFIEIHGGEMQTGSLAWIQGTHTVATYEGKTTNPKTVGKVCQYFVYLDILASLGTY